jgi:4-hydroxy-3-polyprenylbenzoate decarboxylase
MLDQPNQHPTPTAAKGPALDFQQHLKALEAAGLLVRIDRPIDKDTELHPLVRWQFQGGVPEEKRRAFLFTNVIDGSGKKYDMPVVVGALSANPDIYAIGMGKSVGDIGKAWIDAVAHPIAPVRFNTPAP